MNRLSARLLLLTSIAGATATAQLPATQASFGGAPTVAVPFREVHNLLVIPVMINGHGPIQMIFDTGAPILVITDSALAARLELNIVGRAQVGGAGDGDVLTAPLATGITARVGSLEVTGAIGVVGVAADVIPGVDGVIGGAFLRHAIVEIDWDRRELRFHDPAAGVGTIQGDTLALRVEPSLHSWVPGRVGIASNERRIDLHLDTGSRQALSLAQETVAAFSTKPDSSIRTIVGFGSRGAARGQVIRTPLLQLGRAELRGVTTTIPSREPGGAGRVGLPVLKRFDVVIDYPGGRLILRPRENLADPFPFSTTGIVLHPGRDSTRRVVADVMAGSPAWRAGVMVGDTLLAVDETDAAALTENAIDQRVLRPQPASLVRLAMRRGGALVTVRLTPTILLP